MPMDFSEFPPVSKKAWLEQVVKDLKDKPLESLYWQAADGLSISPFVQADDFPELVVPLEQKSNTWEICEAVDAQDPVAANCQMIQALEFGAEAVHFQLPDITDVALLRQMLDGVYLDFVGLHFSGAAVGRNPGAILAALQQLAIEQGLAPAQLRGSLDYDPVTTSRLVDWRYLADLIVFTRTSFPGFQVVAVRTNSSDAVEELVQLLKQGHFYLQKLTERGLSGQDAANALHFQITIGKSYFLEISKIRAFKLLWLHVLQGWKVSLTYPHVSATFAPPAYGDDLYTNMVRATTMAMSAVIGGVDRLSVLPYAAGREGQTTYPPEFGRRIARNVLHLLKMEGGFDQLTDPAAGSYYLENLTGQLAQRAWTQFSQTGP